MIDPILEKYIQIIEDYKDGDVTPDGESFLEIDKDGTKRWLNKRGQLHRRDGPAIEWFDGAKTWYVNDKRHREDGPAVIYANGSKFWYINNKLHRLDGPAIESASGSKYWYINGKRLSEDQFYNYVVNKAIKRKKK